MLLQFTVENFWSLRDACTLNLEPEATKEHPENICNKGKYSALCEAAIYGANASGKTNLHRALTTAILLVRYSNQRQVGENIPVVPFKFDELSCKKPTKFEFCFVAADGKKYIYGYSVTSTEVVEEYLYCYKSKRPSLIFTRVKDAYSFSRQEKKNLEAITKMNTPNKLFLATATNWNVECTTAVYLWFASNIDTYTSNMELNALAMNMYARDEKKYIDFACSLLKQADINIASIAIEKKKASLDAILPYTIAQEPNGHHLVSDAAQLNIYTGHRVLDASKREHLYQTTLAEESLGTQQLFYFAPLLKNCLDEGSVLFIDEIDRSMHPGIVKFIINLFRDKEINTKGAQLLFTTHETTILSLDIFRRDQIYFTEKDSQTGTTALYSLAEFNVTPSDDIEKGYLLGRYGAIPYLKTEELI